MKNLSIKELLEKLNNNDLFHEKVFIEGIIRLGEKKVKGVLSSSSLQLHDVSTPDCWVYIEEFEDYEDFLNQRLVVECSVGTNDQLQRLWFHLSNVRSLSVMNDKNKMIQVYSNLENFDKSLTRKSNLNRMVDNLKLSKNN